MAERLVLKRDRVEMVFDGKFYFEPPVGGRVRGAVFIGNGTFRAKVPPSEFERENLLRILKAEVVESDFRTALLRFSDDTFEQIGKNLSTHPAPTDVQEIATQLQTRVLKETGANLAARLTVSILNEESPGFFFAEFDKGRKHRFTFLLDHQGRIPVVTFAINGGEKGIIYQHDDGGFYNNVWMAFYSLEDYRQGRVQYSDIFDLVAVLKYTMEIDVREPKKILRVSARMDCESVKDGVRALPFSMNDSLGEFESLRLKKALRIKAAQFPDGSSAAVVQEDWEGGLTLLLPGPRSRGERFSVVLEYEGDFMFDSPFVPDCFYPRVTTDWYPRHGYLNRSTFDLTFRHRKKYRVAAVGAHVREESASKGDSEVISQWRADQPIPYATFGVGDFERHVGKLEGTGFPVEFHSLPGRLVAIKEDFILAELMNCLRYFSEFFGPYPYTSFGAMYHPRGFGQGIATLLLLPAADRATGSTYAFIAHETSHQWWGNIVAWRSYRDQWLSEGFAEYSGVLYTRFRDSDESAKLLVRRMRKALLMPPETELGVASGRVVDIGPMIMGHRLSTRVSQNAYGALIYAKGGLVLRMLHFLFTDPETGDSKAFLEMMKDFVKRHSGGWATTVGFREVANEHFARTPMARRLGVRDLNWFFRQWVYQSHLPSYRAEWLPEPQADGSWLVKGTVYQDNAPQDWFMVLPLVLHFGKDQVGRGMVHALGQKTPFTIKVAARPGKVELDPELWVLSEETSTRPAKR